MNAMQIKAEEYINALQALDELVDKRTKLQGQRDSLSTTIQGLTSQIQEQRTLLATAKQALVDELAKPEA